MKIKVDVCSRNKHDRRTNLQKQTPDFRNESSNRIFERKDTIMEQLFTSIKKTRFFYHAIIWP